MIIVSSTNIITRSVLSAWKKAGKNSFQSRVKKPGPRRAATASPMAAER